MTITVYRRRPFHRVHSTLERTSTPTLLPVTLEEVKRALDMEGECDADLDRQLADYIKDAVESVENDSQRALLSGTWKLHLDEFPVFIELRRPPVSAVSSIQYIDTDGNTQTLSSALYQTDLVSEPARIWPAYSQVWPEARCDVNAVTVTFTAGYSSKITVPRHARTAVLVAVKQMYYGCDLGDAYWSAIQRLDWRGGLG